jgi:hypothetical protein
MAGLIAIDGLVVSVFALIGRFPGLTPNGRREQ